MHAMSTFDQQLLRLKHAIGISEDQGVATALGLSKAALSDRKRRGAFPAEKLWALAARHPDWALDVDYVLHGQSDRSAELDRRVNAVGDAAMRAAKIPGLSAKQSAQVQQAIFEAVMTASRGVNVPSIGKNANSVAATKRAVAHSVQPLDEPLLRDSVWAVEKFQRQERLKLSVEAKAAKIVEVYLHFRALEQQQKPASRENVLEFARRAA